MKGGLSAQHEIAGGGDPHFAGDGRSADVVALRDEENKEIEIFSKAYNLISTPVRMMFQSECLFSNDAFKKSGFELAPDAAIAQKQLEIRGRIYKVLEVQAKLSFGEVIVQQFVLDEEAYTKKAETDFLTQLPNREAFTKSLDHAISNSERYKMPISVGVLDIDFFKKINDSYGHAAGDKVLKKVSEVLKGLTERDTDMIARIGGEEFAFVLEATDIAGAEKFAEKLRNAIENLAVFYEGEELKVTVSIGLDEYKPHDDGSRGEGDVILKKADAVLYKAKEQGRNQVVTYESLKELSSVAAE